jgi:glutaredoxin
MFIRLFVLMVLLFTSTSYAQTTQSDAERAAINEFAQCLNKNGVTLYVTWWCPYCKELREAFGEKAYAELRVVECSKPEERSFTEECRSAGIRGVPTWRNSAGSEPVRKKEGLKRFFNDAGCPMP